MKTSKFPSWELVTARCARPIRFPTLDEVLKRWPRAKRRPTSDEILDRILEEDDPKVDKDFDPLERIWRQS
jgi:hypothetical protein